MGGTTTRKGTGPNLTAGRYSRGVTSKGNQIANRAS